eukprot:Skav200573  [mRNA]  locus=scaffold917:265418:266189:+ [translate_table: standard]
MLRQQVHIVLVLLGLGAVLQDVQLSQHLVGEGAGHHERWMASGAAKVHQSARCQDNHTVAVREHKSIDLWLDVLNLDAREVLQVLHGDLIVEMPNVAHNGVIFHLLHVLQSDDLEVASRGSENVHPSMHACKAQIGSISVIKTRAPAPRMAKAQPFPTSPYPATRARLPPIITSVARMMLSGRECLQP